jgi:homoserine dehydrogenase
MRRINIGLLGCGTVGRGFVDLLARERERIRGRDGVDIAVRRILVRDADKPRPDINPSLFSTSAIDILDDGCDIIADSGRELFATAERNRVRIGFEASVCGGIPIVRALRHGLAGDRIESISGILNGTCNYILTRMEQDDLEFDAALRLAQERGFAEADPALDIGGEDAAQKLRILGELAFGARHVQMRVHGICDVTHAEVEQARARRCVVRHVATARRVAGGVEMRVERRELPEFHPLAAIRDENNAVVIRGRAVGELMFQGKGAGSLPTAAAVLSDVIEIAACSRMTT